MSTLNDLIISAISGAEADEGLASSDPTPESEKTASAIAHVEDTDVEKIASALEWYGNTGIHAFVELDKKASPNLDKIRSLMDSDLSLVQAVATAHPLMSSADRADIVETLSAEKTANMKMVSDFMKQGMSAKDAVAKAYPDWSDEKKAALVAKLMGSDKTAAYGGAAEPAKADSPKAEPKAAPKASGLSEPDTDEKDHVSGEQADAADGDASHHPALASNEKAMAYTKAEKSKHQSKSLSRILDSKPFADSVLRESLDAAKTGIDPNIHSKTASDKDAVLSQVREALATKLAERVSEAN